MDYTFVTQLWITESIDVYDKWRPNIVSDAPYIIYGNKEGIDLAKKLRGCFQTYYIESTMKDDPMILLNLAMKFNPYHSSWFLWSDANHCLYKDEGSSEPSLPVYPVCECNPKDCVFAFWLKRANGQFVQVDNGPSFNPEKLLSLPTDKLICTSDFTVCMTHKDFFPNFVRLYQSYKEKDIAHLQGLFSDLFQQCDGFETFIKSLQ